MGIPETQLDTWSHQGSITQSASTYATIRKTLEADDTPYVTKPYRIFLQGSYGNDTNIYAESDVDIVIQFDGSFASDLSLLTENEKRSFNEAYSNATYTLFDFKRDVLATLKAKYKDDVEPGTKAIAIKAGGGRRKADVIVADQFRRYYKFNGTYDEKYDEGIRFFDSSGEQVVNYPRHHSTNLTTKHQATGSWFKPMVRVVKNLRNKLIDNGTIKAGLAPSYYVEGMLYNVPTGLFTSSYGDCFTKGFNWLLKADKTELVCANKQYYLLRESSNVTWREANFDTFISSAVKLWNDWGSG